MVLLVISLPQPQPVIKKCLSQGVLQPGEPGIIREFENRSGKPGNIREIKKKLVKIMENCPKMNVEAKFVNF